MNCVGIEDMSWSMHTHFSIDTINIDTILMMVEELRYLGSERCGSLAQPDLN